MGNRHPHIPAQFTEPETLPKYATEPTFDPHLGFKGERKEKVSPVSFEHLVAAKIPPEQRDTCSDLLINYQVCTKNEFPLPHRCHHERSAYAHCKETEYVDRMKEYEREWRLRKREERIRKKQGEDRI